MEARLSADFSDVRVHDDDAGHRAARAVGARAFTAGSNIAFQRGQYDRASAAGRLTLAHELTHVIQQRSGPVAGTDAGGGIRVSDPADGFERAAQAGARRALAGDRHSPAHPVRTTEPAGQPVTPTGDAVPVQRAVGFEFELQKGSSSVHTVTTNSGGSESLTLKTDSKEPLKYLNASGKLASSGLAYISADNGRVEYVTEPLYTRDEVVSAVNSIVTFHTTPPQGRRTEDFRTSGTDYRVMVHTGTGAKPQASIGVGLEDITTLFKELRALSEEDRTLGTKRRKKEDISRAELNRKVGLLASAGTAEAERLARLVEGSLPAPADPAIDQTQENKAIGFLAIIFKITIDADQHRGATLEDAKYAFSLMSRSDFVSMFYLMNDETRDWLANNLIQTIRNTPGLQTSWLNQKVIGRYHGEVPIPLTSPPYIYEGPTRRAWLQSIITGQPGAKDALSPPRGYLPHNTPNHTPEGMGALGTPDDLSVFELRGLTLGKSEASVPVDSWLDLALIVTDLAAEATGDDDLAGI
jgi:hypothetical protein